MEAAAAEAVMLEVVAALSLLRVAQAPVPAAAPAAAAGEAEVEAAARRRLPAMIRAGSCRLSSSHLS